ncbi:glycogen debranching enzyme [Haemophilus influenzae]|uniref:Glycogen operon protein GlgX homolog n=1 Tax=Haemophilus influenzae (strain ATCC 51907 / DSM 11121 / KW20 / Rd) TaxID=71421 RepID=GLGX_HAEIN|nr:glycogen debranching protein GlgX [Haemophilus influenzae]P45178.1 RecName: Full=Glycogen operon protein GlgX homolog [Haemophilus influenzae Rd KW20]AAC23005.1 glycogen operon protein (glgX) [Haemophilus influenzae Rd KW20]ARB89601.1 glycogen debranching enzyme [Haemophilus influenzae]EEW76563.1 glycogen debranching enzyme GlgX [Haemophilus influenzae RdAW]MCK9046149.1 glycogen debranching protein GlgX [Haemophilus influenzae]
MFKIYNNGNPIPMGYSQAVENNVQITNFALFSAAAIGVELCLFDEQNQETRLPMVRTENVWHLAVTGVKTGTEYAFRIHGEFANPQKLILDPYAKAVNGKPDLSSEESRSWFLLSDNRDNAHLAPRAVVISEEFDWENDTSPNTPWAETIVYELHVKGFSQLNEKIPAALRGTYTGLAHPVNLAYLKELGVTAVELLPVNFHINEPHLQARGLQNYWGYNPLAMFAVEPKYAATNNPLAEFKTMVKAFHKAGIEVILDVVFNHSAESEQTYPTFSQRGIDDQTYYWRNDQGRYINWTGCGNMLNLSSDVGRKWVVDCLRYWVEQCHIDGFRFDLATVLGRDTPDFNSSAQLFTDIKNEPSLQNIKLIAEPWDIGHYGYQVGNFPSYFAEWNDRFRDDLCRFWLWKSGEIGAFAERFAGSSDLFKKNDRLPHTTLNFITAHDGFTLKDLVSYNQKHNETNGEENRDGRNENYSYNHGVEGSTESLSEPQKSAVENNRTFAQSGLLMSLLLANGTPMLLAGDEFGNTQYGNNNAYCQDNEITWLKWANFNEELFELTKQTIALRKQIGSLNKDQWWSDENVQWLNIVGEPMTVEDWQNQQTKALQVVLDNRWLLLINAKAEGQMFHLPNRKWKPQIGTHNVTLEAQQAELSSMGFCMLNDE